MTTGNHVLVVDDSHVISSLLDDFLTEKGFRVSLAGTAEEAFAGIKSRLPDIIVLDLVLPDVHGLQFCRVLKSDSKTRHIPVIMVTAKGNDVKDKVEGLKAGADDYITKPFELAEFYERVNAVLRRVELERERHSQAEAVVVDETPPAEEKPPQFEWPLLKKWQKFVSVLLEPAWFFSWMVQGSSPKQGFGFSSLVVLLICAASGLGRLLKAGSHLGTELLSVTVRGALFVAAWLIVSGVFNLIFPLAGKKTQFKPIPSVLGVSLSPILLSRALELIYILAGGRPGEFSSDLTLIFSSFSSRSVIGFLLGRVDIFELWSLILAGMGLSRLIGMPRKKSFMIVSGIWLAVVGLGALLAQWL